MNVSPRFTCVVRGTFARVVFDALTAVECDCVSSPVQRHLLCYSKKLLASFNCRKSKRERESDFEIKRCQQIAIANDHRGLN